jgi:tetrapyrrole methylase family protein/MazG family protein
MQPEAPASFDCLLEIVKRLRGPGGCPWDIAQSPPTLRASLVDEAWECVSAIDAADDANLQEELGDLCLVVSLIAWMKEQEGAFSVQSVFDRICDKLVRRHPHVFAGAAAPGVEGTIAQWDSIKASERTRAGVRGSALDLVPGSLPPLEKAAELQKKAAKVGFDWPGPEPVWGKIGEEIAEVHAAVGSGDGAQVEEEIGDLLFSVVNLARLLKVDPSLALHGANRKFDRRFREVERRVRSQGIEPSEAGLARLDAAWNQVKSEEPLRASK